MFSVFKKELRAFFSTATGYVVIGLFLLLAGLFLWVIPGEYNILESGYANADGLFYLAPWLFLFLCPAISMRLLAEERQAGTWELLVTRPIGRARIVLGKYLAGWVLVCLALAPTAVYYVSVWHMAEPVGNVDAGAFWGPFIGLFLLAAVYVAIGVFASSLSGNQLVAFVVALVLCFFFYYGFELLGRFFTGGAAVYWLERMGIHAHYKSISRGVVDSRDLAYFFTLAALFVGAAAVRCRKC